MGYYGISGSGDYSTCHNEHSGWWLMLTTGILCLMLVTSPPSHADDIGDDAAVQLYEHGEYREAVGLLAQQIQTVPENGPLLLWLGKSYIKLRKWDDAIRELEKAVQSEPSNALYHLWLGRAYGRKAENASFLAALGPARRVAKEFETAVRLDPENLDARFDLLEFCLHAPGMLGGGRERTMEQAAAIAHINPLSGYSARAEIYKKDEKWDLALKELTQATVEYPGSARAYRDLSDFLFHRGEYAGAAASARKSLEIRPNQGARLILAAAQIKLAQNLPQAEQSLAELAAGPLGDLAPPFEEVYYWLGQAQLAQGKKSAARRSFERALDYNPAYRPAQSESDQAL